MQKNYSSGLTSVVANSINRKKINKEQIKKIVAQQAERDSELITGTFKNYETQGGTLRFCYKIHPQEDLKFYELIDGQVYTLPRGVWKHIATKCYVPKYKYLDNKNIGSNIIAAHNDGLLHGNPMMEVEKNYRFGFMSHDFMSDEEELVPSNIKEVVAIV